MDRLKAELRTKTRASGFVVPPSGGLVLALLCSCSREDHNSPPADSPPDSRPGYAGSASCVPCHAELAALWSASHHALAERELAAELDAVAFAQSEPIRHGSLTSRVQASAARFELVTDGADGTTSAFPAERAIGVSPLVQYLVSAPGGRWQATALAFDPAREDWFDVFGDEDRSGAEWGHWTNRGMNWNSQCADCHVTDLVKGYDAAGDRYGTSWSELGVGCEACHGPGAAHVAFHASGAPGGSQEGVRLFPRGAASERMLDLCGTCHARRSELVERFVPGEPLLDAFLPEIPGLPETYYADGQVHEEDYEYVSFLLSPLAAAGVTCTSCHEPHSARLRMEGDALCLSCHAQPIAERVPAIDASTHSRHDPSGAGARCIACHMPITTYMQRHPRHDHGFTIPDPRLTLELAIPNACNRCHADRDAAWATEAAERMFGAEAIDHGQRARARAVAAARRGVRDAADAVLEWSEEELLDGWRAVIAELFASHAADPRVHAALAELARDDSALVRTFAARSLEGALPGSRELLERMCADPVRAVRVSAAFALRGSVDLSTRASGPEPVVGAARDLSTWLAHVGDQPAGLLMAAEVALAQGSADAAVEHLQRATRWDPYSPPLLHSLAVSLSAAERSTEAVRACERACELAPREATYWHALALARAECGRTKEARAALEEAVRLEPGFTRAWYDLGLLASQLGDAQAADEALDRATTLEPASVDAWFAWAAVLRDGGRTEKARWAAEQALAIEPTDARSRALLDGLR